MSLADAYYLPFAAALVRGRLGTVPDEPDLAALQRGLDAGLRLSKLKRTRPHPRVLKMLGALASMAPDELLHIGSGRGTFLWPLLEAFPMLAVTAIDRDAKRIADLRATSEGGLPR